MKKTMLISAIIASATAYSATAGYIDSNANFEAKKIIGGGSANYTLDGKTHAGLYFGENKDMMFFAGFDVKDKLNSDVKLDTELAYLGARVDSKLTENTGIEVTAAHKFLNREFVEKKGTTYTYKQYDKEQIKKHLLNHLMEKGYITKDSTKEEKEKALRDHGYYNEDEKTTLLSGIFKAKKDNTDFMLASIYTGRNFNDTDNRVETFARLNNKFAKFDTELELTHIYDQNAKDDKVLSKENKGQLLGHIKLSTDKLAKGLELSTKNSFDLLSGITEKQKDSRIYKLKTENKVKYNINNFELTGEAGYYYMSDKSSYPGTIQKIHTPEFKLGVKYEKDGLMLSTMNKNVTQINNMTQPAIPGAKVVAIFNKFETINKVEYKVNEVLTLKALAHYLNDHTKRVMTITPMIPGMQPIPPQISKTNYNTLLTGLGYSAKYEKDNLTLKSDSNASYRLFRYSKEKGNNVYAGFFYSDNSLEYKVNDNVKLNANLDIYDVLEGAKIALKGVKIIDVKGNTFYINPGMKLTYNKDKFEVSNDTQLYFNHNYIVSQTAVKPAILENKKAVALVNNTELKYNTSSTVELMAGLKLDYRYNKFDLGGYELTKGYAKDGGFADDEFRFSGGKNTNMLKGTPFENIYPSKTYKDVKDIKFDEVEKNQQVELTPSVGATLKYMNEKLTIKPKASVTFKFDGEGTTADKVKYSNFSTKLSVDVNYKW